MSYVFYKGLLTLSPIDLSIETNIPSSNPWLVNNVKKEDIKEI